MPMAANRTKASDTKAAAINVNSKRANARTSQRRPAMFAKRRGVTGLSECRLVESESSRGARRRSPIDTGCREERWTSPAIPVWLTRLRPLTRDRTRETETGRHRYASKHLAARSFISPSQSELVVIDGCVPLSVSWWTFVGSRPEFGHSGGQPSQITASFGAQRGATRTSTVGRSAILRGLAS